MNLKQLIAGVVTAGVLVTGTAAVAGADTSSTTAPATTATAGKHQHLRHQLRRAGAKVAASTIGITTKDLVTEVRSGKSVAQVAQAHNVDPQKVIDAVVKAGDAKIDQLVAAGRITAERGAKLKARLPELVAKVVNRVPKAR